MKHHEESAVYQMLTNWAERNDDVRAMIITSSRANPDATPDIFSDYDIQLFVKDTQGFMKDDWLNEFGKILVRWPLTPMTTWSEDWITRLVLFEDGLKIDFQITALESVDPAGYDYGYKVLIDKDDMTKYIKNPTYTEFLIKKPTQDEFQTVVEEFFWEITYVPKSLWRNELYYAKFSLDNVIRFQYLQKMIEWYVGLNHGWSVNTNVSGRYFERFLSKEDWNELESTFAGANVEDSWGALFNTLTFFRRLAKSVAEELGYTYPDEMDKKVTQYCTDAKIINKG